MARYALTFGAARDGERAYITRYSERHRTHIRPSRPLRAGAPVWRVLTELTPTDSPPFIHSTAFRQRRHAEQWHNAIAREES